MSFINKFLFNTLFNNHVEQDDKLKIVKNENNSEVVLINKTITELEVNITELEVKATELTTETELEVKATELEPKVIDNPFIINEVITIPDVITSHVVEKKTKKQKKTIN